MDPEWTPKWIPGGLRDPAGVHLESTQYDEAVCGVQGCREVPGLQVASQNFRSDASEVPRRPPPYCEGSRQDPLAYSHLRAATLPATV